jgi:hypothetical protein
MVPCGHRRVLSLRHIAAHARKLEALDRPRTATGACAARSRNFAIIGARAPVIGWTT